MHADASAPDGGPAREGGTVPDVTASDATASDTSQDVSQAADAPAADASADDANPGTLPIGEWTDAPGACPAGTQQVDLSSVGDLSDASRGQGAFANDGPGTCYFIHNGTYSQDGSVLFWFQHGGTATQPVIFVGESRTGVVIHARGTFDPVGYITLENMTFDLTGYSNGGNAFDTIDLGSSNNVTVSHVTFTGDCTVGHYGAHIESNGATGTLVEACILENYGECGPNGHMDHGLYLASGAGLTIRNNIILAEMPFARDSKFYTDSGCFGTLSNIVVEQNRIYQNGHENQEDGIVINGAMTGTIDSVTIQQNIIYDNYYSGIRFVGTATSGIVIANNTLYDNGVMAGYGNRSALGVQSR